MKYIVIFLLIFSAISARATESTESTESDSEIEAEVNIETDPLAVFVAGNYFLVGKAPDSNKTYQGKLSINNSNGQLNIARNINGVVIKGSAAIESALSGETKVLRMRFTEKGKSYEETCLVSGDLDNYARISCYLYTSDNKTTQPGMEALFHDNTAD